jgi:catechol 2,3-dioxygenase-like lactoylglutathione lyase family enzyme
MVTGFSQIIIDVPDLQAAKSEYQCLLGPFEKNNGLPLRNVEIALRATAEAPAPRLRGLSLLDDGRSPSPSPVDSQQLRGLDLTVVSESKAAATARTSTGICAVDHVVLMTRDADACIELFGEAGFGMRLALDQMVPKWGGRMLFFRCGKMTLEVIHNIDDPPRQDFFWGITYLCENLDASLGKLDEAGVVHSPIRDGRKPGTRVATVKSHNLGLPTLLIEPPQ